jgi:glutaredoxin 3
MKKVTIYTTQYCGFCRRAKALLKERGIPFQEIDVESDDAKREWLVEVTGQQTVPQIFFDQESIGGYTELEALDRSGALTEALSA